MLSIGPFATGSPPHAVPATYSQRPSRSSVPAKERSWTIAQCPQFGTRQELRCGVSHRRLCPMHRTIDTQNRTNRKPCRMYVVKGLALLSVCVGGGGS